MRQWQIHTPDGVADHLPEDCAARRQLEFRLRGLFASRGYQEIETPGIEFYDVYAAGTGFVPQEDLFKFFDQQGRILCLRYDGTVPTARVAATLYRDAESPLRFSYLGNMYRYNEFGGGRQREFSQAGVELMGSSKPEADAEVIATAIAAALACGIEDLQVSIGQVAFFQALLDAWQIPAEQAAALPRLIDSKELVALEELVDQLNLPERARQVLTKMTSGFGTYDILDELEQLVDLPAAGAALQNLRDVLAILADFGVMKYVTIDLGMLQSLNYYTGIIFKGFTYGLGFPLFSGGRYDRLVEAFGRNLSATGFSMGLGLAMTALRRQGKPPAVLPQSVLLGYAPGMRSLAFRTAEDLRRQGWQVICDVQGLQPEGLLASRQSGPIAWLDPAGRLAWLRQEGE